MLRISSEKKLKDVRKGLQDSLVQAAVRNQPKPIITRRRAGALSPRKSVGSESRRMLSKRSPRP